VAQQIVEYAGLQGATLEGNSLDVPGNIESDAGCNERRATAVVEAEDLFVTDTSMHGAGLAKPKVMESKEGLGSVLCEQLMTRPSGLLHPYSASPPCL
jgi:hypothetical protein